MLEAAIDYKEKYEELYLEHINLRHELDQLKRLVFGSRHERFVPSTPCIRIRSNQAIFTGNFAGTGPNH